MKSRISTLSGCALALLILTAPLGRTGDEENPRVGAPAVLFRAYTENPSGLDGQPHPLAVSLDDGKTWETSLFKNASGTEFRAVQLMETPKHGVFCLAVVAQEDEKITPVFHRFEWDKTKNTWRGGEEVLKLDNRVDCLDAQTKDNQVSLRFGVLSCGMSYFAAYSTGDGGKTWTALREIPDTRSMPDAKPFATVAARAAEWFATWKNDARPAGMQRGKIMGLRVILNPSDKEESYVWLDVDVLSGVGAVGALIHSKDGGKTFEALFQSEPKDYPSELLGAWQTGKSTVMVLTRPGKASFDLGKTWGDWPGKTAHFHVGGGAKWELLYFNPEQLEQK